VIVNVQLAVPWIMPLLPLVQRLADETMKIEGGLRVGLHGKAQLGKMAGRSAQTTSESALKRMSLFV
jgi:hypothetical protein